MIHAKQMHTKTLFENRSLVNYLDGTVQPRTNRWDFLCKAIKTNNKSYV